MAFGHKAGSLTVSHQEFEVLAANGILVSVYSSWSDSESAVVRVHESGMAVVFEHEAEDP